MQHLGHLLNNIEYNFVFFNMQQIYELSELF
jgi:hypothetical protein